jgi:hypothetical protein
MILEQDVEKYRNTKKVNKSSESTDEFKCLEKIINRNCLHEKLNSRLNFGNVFYHLVQNLLSQRLLSKTLSMKYTEL